VGVEYLKQNFTAGELAPTLHNRTDITKHNNGVAEATNMVIMSHGGLRRRPGLSKTTDGEVSYSRMIPFVFNTEQKYLIVFSNLSIKVFLNGALQATITSPYTEAQLYEFDYIQSADSMIITHESHEPKCLIRKGSDTSWGLETIQYQNKPQEDLTDQWSADNGYPRSCTIFGGRVYFAGSSSYPTTVWGSKINGFLLKDFSGVKKIEIDFGLGDGEDDMGLEDVLDTDQFNPIVNIFAGRDLQVFTTGGELYNSATLITPSISSWKKQTGYGSKNIMPILIDGATLFVDSSGRTIRNFVFDYSEDSYTAVSASLLSSHIITDVKAMGAIKGTKYDVGDYVYVVNEDGTVAVLNTMRHEEITGWTKWTTDGEFVDVCVVEKDVYFLVKRKGLYFIEKLTEDTYTDHNVLNDGTEPTTNSIVHNGDTVISSIYSLVHTNTQTGVPITNVTTNYNDVFANEEFKVIADYSMQPDSIPTSLGEDLNEFTITRDAYRLEVGLNYETKITTLPIAPETQKGASIFRRRRVVKADISMIDSLGVYVRDNFKGDREFTAILDKTPELFTGFKEYYLLGYDRLQQIEVSQKEPLPFTLTGIGLEIEY
jgi:hypothetical protein